ncbi:hypothetical protein N9I89_01615 [Porticoccaceae bacterium]|nr:hypothetical protein [Porticoccaceae bacterium]
MQKIKSDMSKIRRWLPLIFCFLSFSSCVLWIEAPAHLEQLEDDQYVGKTLLIHPSAGGFTLKEHWYFGKQSGDSYFYSQRLDKNSELSPNLYKIMGYYKEVYHGGERLFVGSGLVQYLIEPVDGKTKNRLFFSEETIKACDPKTGIKVDFVCK